MWPPPVVQGLIVVEHVRSMLIFRKGGMAHSPIVRVLLVQEIQYQKQGVLYQGDLDHFVHNTSDPLFSVG